MHDAAFPHHGNAIGKQYRLVDIVCDEDDGLPQALMELPQLDLQASARNGIERAEGLVHKQGARARGNGARDPDPLLLSSGELRGITRSVLPRRQTDQAQQLVHPSGDARFIPSQQTRHDRHVLRDRVMREQPALLDDVAHVTAQVWAFELLGRGAVDVDDPAARVVEAVDQFEERRLAAAGRDQ